MPPARRKAIFTRHLLNVTSPLGRISHAGELTKSRIEVGMRPQRVFDLFAVVLLLEGEGRYVDVTHNESSHVRPGDLIIIQPGSPHYYGPESGGTWHEMFLVFEGRVFDTWAQTQLLPTRPPVIHLQPVHIWQQRLKAVMYPEAPTCTTSVLSEVCRLQAFLALALCAVDDSNSTNDRSAWLAQARDAIRNEADLRLVARQLHCSYDTFRRRFKRLTGIAPAHYRSQAQIERACALMYQTTLADKQIARELGFCDGFHFSRRFKQITGMSPRAYRQQML